MIGSGQPHLIKFLSGMRMIFDSRLLVETEFMPFGASTVIGHKHDERIVQLTVFLQFIHYPTDICIHYIYHSGKDRHTPCQIGLLIFRQGVPCLIYKVNCIISNHIRCVESSFFIVPKGTVFRQTGIYCRIPERIEPTQQAVVLLKTTKNRIGLIPQMPFPRHCREISRLFQYFGNCNVVRIGTEARISFRPCRVTTVHMPQPCLMRIKSCQQIGAGRTTACTVIHLRHANAILRQFIQ